MSLCPSMQKKCQGVFHLLDPICSYIFWYYQVPCIFDCFWGSPQQSANCGAWKTIFGIRLPFRNLHGELSFPNQANTNRSTCQIIRCIYMFWLAAYCIQPSSSEYCGAPWVGLKMVKYTPKQSHMTAQGETQGETKRHCSPATDQSLTACQEVVLDISPQFAIRYIHSSFPRSLPYTEFRFQFLGASPFLALEGPPPVVNCLSASCNNAARRLQPTWLGSLI